MTEDQKTMVTLNGMVERLEDEVRRLKEDLDVNAAMLARQCDLAREAETKRDALQRDFEHAKMVVKAADRELAAERKEVARLREENRKLQGAKDFDCPVSRLCENGNNNG